MSNMRLVGPLVKRQLVPKKTRHKDNSRHFEGGAESLGGIYIYGVFMLSTPKRSICPAARSFCCVVLVVAYVRFCIMWWRFCAENASEKAFKKLFRLAVHKRFKKRCRDAGESSNALTLKGYNVRSCSSTECTHVEHYNYCSFVPGVALCRSRRGLSRGRGLLASRVRVMEGVGVVCSTEVVQVYT